MSCKKQTLFKEFLEEPQDNRGEKQDMREN